MSENEIITPERFRYLLESRKHISNYHLTKEIIIDNHIFLGNSYISISNCVFDYEFQLKGNLFNQKLIFSNCIFNQRFLTPNLSLESLQFTRCTFNQYFSSKGLNSKLISFELCIFNLQKELILDQFNAEKIEFLKNEFNRDIQLIPQIAKTITLAGGESTSTLTLSNKGNKNTIHELFLECKSNHKTDFLLRNLNIRYLSIYGELKGATLSINNINLKIGIIKYFSNLGNLLINSVVPDSEKSILVLKGANLGQAIISSTDFSKFSRIQLSNSNLVGIVPVNIEWCESKSLKNANHLSDRKETYRQLKIVADKNSDTPTKLLYHKYEMRAYLKVLKKFKGKLPDRIILRTNQISNNHGLNWHLAFFWLLGFSIIWYTLVKNSLGQTEFAPELIGNEIGRFINFINPAHFFDRVFYTDKEIQSSNAFLYDGLSRITSSYFLYQFISAFRKYSKK